MGDGGGFYQRVKRVIAQYLAELDVPVVSTGAISGASLTVTGTAEAATLKGTGLTSGRVAFATTGGALTDDADLTFATDTLSATKVAASSLTSTRVPYAGSAGLLGDSANLTFNGTTLSAAGVSVGSTGLGSTGAITPTGGLVATSNGRISDIPIGAVALGSLGSDLVHVAGTLYFAEIWLPANKTVTGLAVLNGSADGTHKLIVALANSAGTVVKTSALAGTMSAGTDAFQEIAFTASYAAVGPARYWAIIQCEGITPKTRRIAASTYLNFTGSLAGVFGTIPASITPPTATEADSGPIVYAY